jgi:hypothetical protein
MRALRKFKKSALNDHNFREKWPVFMRYTMEFREAFEKEFSRNHKDKEEWLQRMTDGWNRNLVREAVERQASRTMAAKNLSFQGLV